MESCKCDSFISETMKSVHLFVSDFKSGLFLILDVYGNSIHINVEDQQI